MSKSISNQLNQERILKLRSPKLYTQHIPVKKGLWEHSGYIYNKITSNGKAWF